jgi:hypothetical protein
MRGRRRTGPDPSLTVDFELCGADPELPGHGHLALMEDPARFNVAVINFLERVQELGSF